MAEQITNPIRLFRPYREDVPLIAVGEAYVEDAESAFARVPELEDALADCNAYVERIPDKIADFVLSYSSDGDTSDPWQAGHNYAMREAARMIREKWYDLPTGGDRA